jgi:fibronectin-binding autotransporter adhesin
MARGGGGCRVRLVVSGYAEGTGTMKTRQHRFSLSRAVLTGVGCVFILSATARAQYTADFQTNTISNVTSNWSGNYLVGSNTFADVLLIQNSGVLSNGFGSLGQEVSSSNNSVLVTDPGSVWSSDWVTIGYYGAGNRLAITNGGQIAANIVSYVAYQVSSSYNSILVAGTGSVWNSGSNLYVGFFGADNSLVISNGGQVVTGPFGVVGRFGSSSNNSVLVTGPGSLWSCDGWELTVGGGGGPGNSLVISNGGQVVNGGYGYVGYFSSGCSALVTGSGSVWSNLYDLYLGEDGGGNKLVISDGGQLVNDYAYVGVGYDNNSSNSVLVTGPVSIWRVSDNLNVGWSGPWSSLVISNGGVVIDQSGYIGDYSISNSALVTGTGSVWSNNSDLYVGSEGAANQLTIAAGGQVVSGYSYLGYAVSSTNNSVLITDTGSVWNTSSTNWDPSLCIGYLGAGNSLVISNGGKVVSGNPLPEPCWGACVGWGVSSSNNTMLITGSSSVWSNGNELVIGGGSPGNKVVVSDGGVVASSGGEVGYSSESNSLVVSGAGSVGSYVYVDVGIYGAGNSLVVSDGGRVVSGQGSVGDWDNSSNNSALVTGPGSVWSNSDSLWVGAYASGNSLVVSNGGQLVSRGCNVGFGPKGSSNSVLVSGSGSVWSSPAGLTIGGSGDWENGGADNSLVVSNGGEVVNGGGCVGYDSGSSNNSVRVTDGGVWRNDALCVGCQGSSNSLVVAGGSVYAASLVVGAASATCDNLVQLDSGSVIVTNATGDAVLEVRNGSFILNGGMLQVDRFVMTNACAQFVHTGGTLIYSTAVLDPNRDDDGDGMLNGWEQSYGLDPLNAADANADPDGDGFTNLQEFQAGTDPTNSASAFRITDIVQEGDDVRVTWTMGAGKTNALQAAAGDGGYYTNNFADVFIVTNTVGSVTNFLDTGGATNTPARYYRVRLVP